MSDVEMSAGTEQKSSAPVFRLVVFQNIPETYLFDQPINCNFTVDSSYSPSAQDRVGLYKVGWRSLSDHVSFENVELPLNENSGKVTFNDVPKDDEEFYQFCYVSSSSHVYGASSPFQFVADDFEIIEEIPDASLLDCDTTCEEARNDKNVVEMESKTSERPVLEERPHTASSDLEDHLSKLTEENKKLAEELSSLKMQMTKSQFLGEEEEQKCVDGLEKLNLAITSQNDHEGKSLSDVVDLDISDYVDGMGDAATVAMSSKETSLKEEMLYSTKTWFHNPYSNYIPANITDFSSIKTVTSELWPKNEIVPGN